MTEVLAVRRADVDQSCRCCTNPIYRGQRVALLAGLGGVHLKCLLARQAANLTKETSVEEPAATPATTHPGRPPMAHDADEDPAEWWDR